LSQVRRPTPPGHRRRTDAVVNADHGGCVCGDDALAELGAAPLCRTRGVRYSRSRAQRPWNVLRNSHLRSRSRTRRTAWRHAGPQYRAWLRPDFTGVSWHPGRSQTGGENNFCCVTTRRRNFKLVRGVRRRDAAPAALALGSACGGSMCGGSACGGSMCGGEKCEEEGEKNLWSGSLLTLAAGSLLLLGITVEPISGSTAEMIATLPAASDLRRCLLQNSPEFGNRLAMAIGSIQL